MKNWKFKQWNTILGWVVFAVALVTYFSTIEPKLSFWDCGEYISSAVKLEVTHAPGAALFQLVGAVAGFFAFGNGENYGLIINGMSALFSAFTILFLFWTITHLVRRMFNKDFEEVTTNQEIATLFAGTIGALAFTFSDSFWFSAVEGEVYSMASLFIALIVWLITKWENEFSAQDNERWILLIFFIIGLSVGVHMMCMLAIPAVCLIYYARKYEFSWKSFFIANLITLLILGAVFKGIFPLIMTLFGKLEIFFVNGIGLPFHSGTIAAFILMIALAYFGIHYAKKTGKALYQTIVLSVVFMMIGFSCWLVIPIRANANPPMNLNNPDNAIGMLDYYNREQYGDWPTIYGQNYTAHLAYDGIERDESGNPKRNITGAIYEKDESTGTYRKVGDRFNYVYNPKHISFMPRMFNENPNVMGNYINMYGAPEFTMNPELIEYEEATKIYSQLRKKFEDGTITANDYLQNKPYRLIEVQPPSLRQNLDYFFSFQNGYYFVRYLMWNFVGKQNDLEGHMENTRGNWVSGISFIDDLRLGNQDEIPSKFNNESTVYFFFLPLLLGIIGMFFQLNKDFGRFYALLSLFILTSVGIIFYTGVKPFEPRERDYAMVGSFYAFAIWIGLGAGGILWFLQDKLKSKIGTFVMGAVLLGIPLMMGFQNYNAHDRSDRYTAYDYAYSVLKPLPKDDILFVYGDNDTYPVWGVQETDGLRTDVKVVNFTLLATPWNIDQVRRQTYQAPPIPSSLEHEDYRDGTNEQVVLFDAESLQSFMQGAMEKGESPSIFKPFVKYIKQDSMTVKEAIAFVKNKTPEKDEIAKLIFGEDRYEKFAFLPVSKFIIPVNKANAVASGIIKKSDLDEVVDYIPVNYQGGAMFKNSLMMMDILANFDWKRPIHFSSGGVYDRENIFYLDDYLQYDGFNYRLVPIKTKERADGEMGRVDADELYTIVKSYKWGNFKDLSVHFDETATSNIISYRNAAGRAAEALALKGEKQKALELLDLVSKEIPVEKYNEPSTMATLVYGYILAGQSDKGLGLAQQLQKNILKEYDYYAHLDAYQQQFVKSEMGRKSMEYSLIVAAVADAYKKIGQEDKAYDYLVKSLEPIDKRFDTFIEYLNSIGKERANEESVKVQKITRFYSYLFDVIAPYDSTFAKEKESQMTHAIINSLRIGGQMMPQDSLPRK
ncbi:MAG: glycosyltransferase [Flavobacteriales bacterium]|nr:MAG: glycosyltransferase [Flavobacteriales bacterium]